MLKRIRRSPLSSLAFVNVDRDWNRVVQHASERISSNACNQFHNGTQLAHTMRLRRYLCSATRREQSRNHCIALNAVPELATLQ